MLIPLLKRNIIKEQLSASSEAPLKHAKFFIVTVILYWVTAIVLSAQAEQLVFIKTVSTSKKSFVINRGRLDEVRKDQLRAFSGPYASVIARAIEVGPQTSLWKVEDKRMGVPFKKGELVTISTQTQALWANMLEVEQQKTALEKKIQLAKLQQPSIIIRGAYIYTFSETTSQVAPGETSIRQGLHGEILLNKWWELEPLAFSYGLRLDQEKENIRNVRVAISTWRLMLAGEVAYHFSYDLGIFKNHYLAAGMAAGFSNSRLLDLASKLGPTIVLPILRLGTTFTVQDKYFIDLDCAVENLIAWETFTNRTKQKSNFLNAKLGLGVRF